MAGDGPTSPKLLFYSLSLILILILLLELKIENPQIERRE